jgi:glutamate racemase
MADPRPIGMLDSGVGGLSVLREVRLQLPDESILYVAVEAHLPYGPRDRSEIRRFAFGIVRFLLDQGCKLIAIPCNAANAAALHHLRGEMPNVPIVGMEPAIKPAAERTRTGVVGVITTRATYQGELFASVIDRFAQGIRVETQVCPDLVTLVERGAPDNAESRVMLSEYLAPLKAAGIDQLVLGCTHFSFLTRQIQEELGDHVTIVDPAPAVARQIGRVLAQRDIASSPGTESWVNYYTSGSPDDLRSLVATLIGEEQIDAFSVKWRGVQLGLASASNPLSNRRNGNSNNHR